MVKRFPTPSATVLVACSALGSLACDSSPNEPKPVPQSTTQTKPKADGQVSAMPKTAAPAKGPAAYSIPDRTPEELDRGLRAACKQGAQSKQPLLIEFSAPWCGDCRRLAEMKQEPALAKKLQEVPHYVVNVGHFDRHDGLLEDFKIRAIANWKVVGTDDCSSEVATWPRLAGRTLEPQSGDKITSTELVAWLDEKMK